MRREENQLDVTECFIAFIIRSTCFGHFYAHHQELETICVCVVTAYGVECLVTGCRGSGAEQQAVCPGRGMLHNLRVSSAINPKSKSYHYNSYLK